MKNKKGYTLAELMIVVIILGLLFGISGNMYLSQRQNLIYRDSISQVLNMIKAARNYAITSRPYYDESSPAAVKPLVIPPEGYGIFIEKDSATNKWNIKLFANKNAVPGFPQYADFYNNSGQNKPEDDQIEEEYTLPDISLINAIKADVGAGLKPVANNKLTIIFRPPLAEVEMDDSVTLPVKTFNEIVIEFAKNDPGAKNATHILRLNRIARFPELELK